MTERRCTMPNIPWFRDWFESKFHNECKLHDKEYKIGKCKLCSDYRLATSIAEKGYVLLSLGVFIAVNMPWVWYIWFKRRN